MSDNVQVKIRDQYVRVMPCVSVVLDTYGNAVGDTCFGDTATATFGDPHVERPLTVRRCDPEEFVVGRKYRVVYVWDACDKRRNGAVILSWNEMRVAEGTRPEEYKEAQ